MPGSPIKVGPFTGGLNTYSDTTAIADNEAAELLNFDIDLDGSLVTRPPILYESYTPGSAQPVRLLGYYTATNGNQYLIASNISPTVNATYAYFAGVWTTITTSFSAAAMVQYANKAWLISPAGSAISGGSWDPTVGFTVIAAIKKGNSAVIYKERLWIAEGGTAATSSRLFFSNPANFAVWNASDFVDIRSGDGQDIIDMIMYADTIVLFKQNSTYIFSYDAKPTAGQVRQISGTIGIAGRDCVFEYENNLYLFHDKDVYTLVNWNYDKLNIKVPLEIRNTKPNQLLVPFAMSRMNDRLILRYYDNYYVYGLKTRVWALWTTPRALGRWFQVPTDATVMDPDKFVAASAWTDVDGVYSLIEAYTIDRTENFRFTVTSRTFDFETPHAYKRLFWWGADSIAKSSFTGVVFPISYGRKLTWNDAKLRTWNDAKAFTWARPADISIQIESPRTVSGSNNRTFVKFLKSLRFRQVNFQITGTTTSSLTTSPMRIFGFTIFVDAKAKVSQLIN